MLRWLTAGESHGQALVAILEGLPAHVQVTSADIAEALARRRLGFGRGARMKFEADAVTILGGIRHGESQGGPVAIQIGNSEWPKWQTVMAADPVDAAELEGQARNAALTRPRPGHADLVGMQKYDFAESRPILERASARETAARVALGRVAGSFLHQAFGVRVLSHVVELGTVSAPAGLIPTFDDLPGIDDDPVRCFDRDASAAMIAEVETAQKDGDTLGGVVEVVVWGLPPGLGSHVHWDRRLDAQLAGALMGIQAIKGVEVGDGFELARTRGSRAHDEIVSEDGRIARASHRSGGTEGGMSTGEVLRVRAAMKPISTVPRALRTIDVVTGEPAVAHHQRSDVCAVPAAGVVAEAMVALGAGQCRAGEVRRGLGQGDPAQCLGLPGRHRRARAAGARMTVTSAVVVMGAPGSGKSTIGPRLAEQLALPFVDADAVIEQREGRPITQIFVEDGEPAFRALEEQVTAELLAEPIVLALGGGAILSAATRAALRGHRVIWLKVGVPAAVQRIGLNAARPLLLGNVRGRLVQLLADRLPLYAECATESVETDRLTPDEVLDQIMSQTRV